MSYELNDRLVANYPDNPSYWKNIFARGINNPDSWVTVADDIVLATSILKVPLIEFWKSCIEHPHQIKREYFIHGVYLMLSAYALENLFKAIIVKSKGWSNEVIEESIPSELLTHNLVKLAKHSGLNFTESGNELLIRQSEYAIWAGRYPVPIQEKHLMPRQLPNGIKNTLLVWRGSDIRSTEEIIEKLKNVIDPRNNTVDESKYKNAVIYEWEKIVLNDRIIPWSM